MKKENVFIVSLCGGLGNQLFQVSHALAVTQGTILAETSFGFPRRNELGEPEVFSFTHPERIRNHGFSTPSTFLSRTASYLLRSRSNPNGIERIKIYRTCISIICAFLFSLYFKRLIRIVHFEGLGIKSFKEISSSNLQIGYFQSYLTSDVDSVLSEMKAMTPINISKLASEYLEDSEGKHVLVVHVRLGDYKSEQNFGMPSHQYYENSIKFALAKEPFTDVWIFSDEISLAKRKLSISTDLPVRWIGNEELTTAETFEIMKSGDGFIISNSSYSWWAARLSHAENPIVISPKPWFKNLKEPDNLIPSEWVRLNAHYE